MATKIAGQYRHRFPNGDVESDKFISTDTLIFRPVGAVSIHFDVELNFYDGHECSLSGVKFRDITGGCKLSYCGERGGWDGERITFKERIRLPAAR